MIVFNDHLSWTRRDEVPCRMWPVGLEFDACCVGSVSLMQPPCKLDLIPSHAGENLANAPLHPDPAGVSGRPVGREDEPVLSGSAFHSHPHRPSSHVHDRPPLLCHGDEMRKSCSQFTSSSHL